MPLAFGIQKVFKAGKQSKENEQIQIAQNIQIEEKRHKTLELEYIAGLRKQKKEQNNKKLEAKISQHLDQQQGGQQLELQFQLENNGASIQPSQNPILTQQVIDASNQSQQEKVSLIQSQTIKKYSQELTVNNLVLPSVVQKTGDYGLAETQDDRVQEAQEFYQKLLEPRQQTEDPVPITVPYIQPRGYFLQEAQKLGQHQNTVVLNNELHEKIRRLKQRQETSEMKEKGQKIPKTKKKRLGWAEVHKNDLWERVDNNAKGDLQQLSKERKLRKLAYKEERFPQLKLKSGSQNNEDDSQLFLKGNEKLYDRQLIVYGARTSKKFRESNDLVIKE